MKIESLPAKMINSIDYRGWRQFLAQPEPAVVPVVKEFYANVLEHRGKVVLVRGKMVPFHVEAINAFYQTPDIPP